MSSTNNINNEKVEEQLEEMTTNWNERVESFDNMNLKEELLRGIYSYGFEKPSLIQQKAIMPLIRCVISAFFFKRKKKEI